MTASVLIVCGHVGIENLTSEGMCPNRDVATLRRGTGSRGEREWTGHVGPLMADRLRGRGVEVVVTDARYSAAVYGRRWDVVIALHYQRDRPESRAFAAAPAPGRGYIDDEAQRRAKLWLARFMNEYPVVTGIPVTQQYVTANMTDHYAWCFLEIGTAAVLVEAGHADIDAAVLFELGVSRVVNALATITFEYLEANLGVLAPQPAPAPAEPYPLASFPVSGVWDGDARALEAAVASYSEGRAPAGLGAMYAQLAAGFKIRADVALAQAMHETGRFRFDGTDPIFSAKLESNNWCGIKTRDGKATARFPSLERGVLAHLAHLAWYAHPDHVNADCSEAVDPRHFGPTHKNNVRVIHDLGGKWAPSPDYGKGVARHLAEIRARVAGWTPPPARRELGAIAADLERLARDLRDRAA